MSDRLLATWTYAVEIIAALLVYVVLRSIVGADAIASFVERTSSDWKTGLGIAFGAAIALWAAFLALLATDFGAELRRIGAASMYSGALVYSLFVFLGSLLLLMGMSGHLTLWTGQLLAVVLVYATLNCVTMVRNLHGLLKLWQERDRS